MLFAFTRVTVGYKIINLCLIKLVRFQQTSQASSTLFVTREPDNGRTCRTTTTVSGQPDSRMLQISGKRWQFDVSVQVSGQFLYVSLIPNVH